MKCIMNTQKTPKISNAKILNAKKKFFFSVYFADDFVFIAMLK